MSPWFIILIVVLLCLYMLWNNMFWNDKYSKFKNKASKPVIADFELSTEIVEEILFYLGSVGYDFKEGEKDVVRDAIYQIVSRKNRPINEPPELAKYTEASLCGECRYVSPKECHPQTENHLCSLFNKRLYHLSYHPDLVRLPDCHKSYL